MITDQGYQEGLTFDPWPLTDEDGHFVLPQDYKIVEVLFDGVWASPKLTRRTPEVHSYQVS